MQAARWVIVPKYEIRFYESSKGKSPVEDFLRRLDTKTRTKCLRYMDLLADQGLFLKNPYVEKLEDGLWELKPEWNGNEYRLLFTFHKGEFWIVHAVQKKAWTLPKRELNTARRRIKEVQELS